MIKVLISKSVATIKRWSRDWRAYLVPSSLILSGALLYTRIQNINPAILGDEYIYAVNARKGALWEPALAGDFSNYLFNLVYQVTDQCGPSFYSCAKALNVFFFMGFALVVFAIAFRYLGFWPAYGFMVAVSLSPLSVYTSMFLPESMYFFFIALVFAAAVRAIDALTFQNTALLGVLLGITSLVKPHAWLSAIPLALVVGIVALYHQSDNRIRRAVFHTAALAGSAIAARVMVGLIIAGPQVLDFFGQYAGGQTIQEIADGTQGNDVDGTAFSGPLQGVIDLFGSQLGIHIVTIVAVMGISILALTSRLLRTFQLKTADPIANLSLLLFVWLAVLVVEIVAFTGWVTGGGDDHTTRVLIRYYEFLLVFVPLGGLAVFQETQLKNDSLWIRWPLAAVVVSILSVAYTGFFGNLTIQIADAPTLAGLVVNLEVFNASALVGFLAVATYATFPRFVKWTYLVIIPVLFAGTGFQAIGQYDMARGSESSADRAGLYLQREFSDEEIGDMMVLASSRFDATNIGFWANSNPLVYELYVPGSSISSDQLPSGASHFVVNGDLTVYGDVVLEYEGDGFRIYANLEVTS